MLLISKFFIYFLKTVCFPIHDNLNELTRSAFLYARDTFPCCFVLPRLHFEESDFDQIFLNLVAKCSIYGETRKMKKTVNIYRLSFEINLEKADVNLLFSPYLGPQSNPFQNLDKSAALQEVKDNVMFNIKYVATKIWFLP